jgi:hypothetical protein
MADFYRGCVAERAGILEGKGYLFEDEGGFYLVVFRSQKTFEAENPARLIEFHMI